MARETSCTFEVPGISDPSSVETAKDCFLVRFFFPPLWFLFFFPPGCSAVGSGRAGVFELFSFVRGEISPEAIEWGFCVPNSASLGTFDFDMATRLWLLPPSDGSWKAKLN